MHPHLGAAAVWGSDLDRPCDRGDHRKPDAESGRVHTGRHPAAVVPDRDLEVAVRRGSP